MGCADHELVHELSMDAGPLSGKSCRAYLPYERPYVRFRERGWFCRTLVFRGLLGGASLSSHQEDEPGNIL